MQVDKRCDGLDQVLTLHQGSEGGHGSSLSSTADGTRRVLAFLLLSLCLSLSLPPSPSLPLSLFLSLRSGMLTEY